MDNLRQMAGSMGSPQEFLNGINFPVSKDELIDAMRQKGAPEPMLNQVEKIDTTRFESAQDVITKIPGVH